MRSNTNSDSLSQWLKNLAQESWHLELLVSGFSILLLIQGLESFGEYVNEFPFRNDINNDRFAILLIFYSLLWTSMRILAISLIFHLFLRGFWIGAIGLRSVQESFEINILNYSDYFKEKLKKRISNLDELVIKLDGICSIVFSVSFLLISVVISFAIFIAIIAGISSIFRYLGDVFPSIELAIDILGAIIGMAIVFSGMIYAIDYISLGFFKKFKRFSKLYYPFYKFWSIVTLAFISRNIYYHLIAKFTKRKIRLAYLLILGLFILSTIFSYSQFGYYSDKDGEYNLESNAYDDERRKSEMQFISKASIPSRIINSSYLPLFIIYNPSDNVVLDKICEEYDYSKQSGWNLNFSMKTRDDGIEINGKEESVNNPEESLKCFAELYQLSLNGQALGNPEFRFYTHPDKSQQGILTMLSAEKFKSGKNTITIFKKQIGERDSLETDKFATILFWFDQEK